MARPNYGEPARALRDTLHLDFLYPLKTFALLQKVSGYTVKYANIALPITSSSHCKRHYTTDTPGSPKAGSTSPQTRKKRRASLELRPRKLITRHVKDFQGKKDQNLLQSTKAPTNTEVVSKVSKRDASLPLTIGKEESKKTQKMEALKRSRTLERTQEKSTGPQTTASNMSRHMKTTNVTKTVPRVAKNLDHFFELGIEKKYRLAWDMYRRVEKPTPSQKNRLMAYLQTSDEMVDKRRILQTKGTMRMLEFTLAGADAVVDAYLSRGQVEPASQFIQGLMKCNCAAAVSGAARLILCHIQQNSLDAASAYLTLIGGFLAEPAKESVADGVVSGISDFKLQFINWLEQAQGVDKEFLIWLARGFLRLSAQKDEPQLAIDAADVLKHLYLKNMAMEIPLKDHFSVMGQLHKHNKPKIAVKLYSLFRDTKFEENPNPDHLSEVLYRTLTAFGSLNEMKNMEMVFDDWLRFGLRPTEGACVYMMRYFSRYGEISVVQGLFEYYESRFPMRIDAIEALMQTHTIRGELTETQGWFNNIPRYGVTARLSTYNILLNAYKRADDVNGAFKLFNTMLEFTGRLSPDLISFQTIMSLCAERGDSDAAEQLRELAVKRGITPDLSIENALLYSYVKTRDPEGTRKATDLINRVTNQNVKEKTDETDFRITRMWNSLLTGYLWTGELDLMSTTYQRMRAENVPFDAYTYAILMHGLCITGKVSEAEKMLEILEREESVKPVAAHYATLMLDHMFRKDIGKVWDVYRRMQKSNISPTFIIQALLIQVLASHEYEWYKLRGGTLFLAEAESILAQTTSGLDVLDLESPDSVKSTFPAFLFVPLLQIYAREGSYQRAMDLFDQFLALQEKKMPSGTRPNLRMYLAVMNGLYRARDTGLLLEVWERAKGEALVRFAKSALPLGLSRKVLRTRNNELSSLFTILIRALSLDGNMDRIYQERQEYLEYGYEIDNVNWNDLVQANSLNGRLLEAFRICEKLLIEGWSDPRSRRKGIRYSRPKFYPFLRTMEGLLAQVKAIQASVFTSSDPKLEPFKKAEQQYPMTWAALDALDNGEYRIAKDVLYKASRDEWGHSNAARRRPPTYEDLIFEEEELFKSDKETGVADLSNESSLVPGEGTLIMNLGDEIKFVRDGDGDEYFKGLLKRSQGDTEAKTADVSTTKLASLVVEKDSSSQGVKLPPSEDYNTPLSANVESSPNGQKGLPGDTKLNPSEPKLLFGERGEKNQILQPKESTHSVKKDVVSEEKGVYMKDKNGSFVVTSSKISSNGKKDTLSRSPSKHKTELPQSPQSLKEEKEDKIKEDKTENQASQSTASVLPTKLMKPPAKESKQPWAAGNGNSSKDGKEDLPSYFASKNGISRVVSPHTMPLLQKEMREDDEKEQERMKKKQKKEESWISKENQASSATNSPPLDGKIGSRSKALSSKGKTQLLSSPELNPASTEDKEQQGRQRPPFSLKLPSDLKPDAMARLLDENPEGLSVWPPSKPAKGKPTSDSRDDHRSGDSEDENTT